MFDRIKDQLMTRHYTKLREAEGFTGVICPKIQKNLDKNIEWSKNCFSDGAGDGLFKVGDMFSSAASDYIVDLKGLTCTCMRWAQSGIPCPHAISCMRHENLDPINFVDGCYTTEMYKRAYGNIVYPCKDRTEWEKTNGPTILPPHYVRHVGRPTKSRRKCPGEVDARGGGKKITRHGIIIHCSYCGEPDHNAGGCPYLKAGQAPPSASQPVIMNVEEPVISQVISQACCTILVHHKPVMLMFLIFMC